MAKELQELTSRTAAGGEVTRFTGADIDVRAKLLTALRRHTELPSAVPTVLGILEREPLASAGVFRGDLLRALIDLPAEFWHHEPALFRRYQNVVRAGAIARMSLPRDDRMAFWTRDTH